MALVSGKMSTLNPNAQPFIPAAVRQVEDFSPEWWDLVKTSTWFQEYWLSQNEEETNFELDDGFSGNDAVELLPDFIDLDVDEDVLNMEAQFEEFLQSSDSGYAGKIADKGVFQNGFSHHSEVLAKSLSGSKERSPKSPRELMKFWDKPAKHVSPRCCPHFIQQPRRSM